MTLLLLGALLATVLLPVPLSAQQELPWRSVVWEEDFSAFEQSSYYLGTDTRLDAAAEQLVLTPNEASRSGRIFLPRLHSVNYFDVSFRGRFGFNGAANNSGADGIVFVMGAIYDYPPNGGGALDFDGCLGYGIEFDTYNNDDRNDRSSEHIAVIKDESGNHLISETLTVPTLEDNAWHRILIRFRDGSVEAFLDGVSRLSHDIAGFSDYDGFYGFSSATGSAFNEHRIDDIRLELPTRTSMDFGVVSLCEPVRIDTSLLVRNNHPDGTAFTIIDIDLVTSSPDVFTLPQMPVPSVVPHGGLVRIPLRITPTEEGTFTAILQLQADNGECVFDTLRIAAERPRLEWDPAGHDFPIVLVGRSAVTTLTLRNTARVPGTITALRWRDGVPGAFTAQAALPKTLQPGDTLSVTVRFAPPGETNYSDSLFAETDCAVAFGARFRGTGINERMKVTIQPLLLLSPGETGQMDVRLDSVPTRFAVSHIAGEIRIDPSFVAFNGFMRNDDVLSPSADLDLRFLGDRATFEIVRSTPFERAGPLFSFGLTTLTSGPECRPVQLANLRVIGEGGINDSSGGKVCINPSCRHPEGLYAEQRPLLRVYPHPVTEGSSVLLRLPVEQSIRLTLIDLLGEERDRIADAVLSAGKHAFPLSLYGLPAGIYMLRLTWDGGIEHQSILIPR